MEKKSWKMNKKRIDRKIEAIKKGKEKRKKC